MITVLLLCLASGVLHSQRRNTWSYIAPSLTQITWSSANKSWIQILHVNRDLRDKYVQQYSSRQLLRLVVYYSIMCPFPPQAFSLHTITLSFGTQRGLFGLAWKATLWKPNPEFWAPLKDQERKTTLAEKHLQTHFTLSVGRFAQPLGSVFYSLIWEAFSQELCY